MILLVLTTSRTWVIASHKLDTVHYPSCSRCPIVWRTIAAYRETTSYSPTRTDSKDCVARREGRRVLSRRSHCANDEPVAAGSQRDSCFSIGSDRSAESRPAQMCAARVVELEAAARERRFLLLKTIPCRCVWCGVWNRILEHQHNLRGDIYTF